MCEGSGETSLGGPGQEVGGLAGWSRRLQAQLC